jgi:uncharacterized protein YjbI with pentapeptide repeats
MGQMTSSYGRTPADVRTWPTDPAARQALQRYLAELPEDHVTVQHLFDGSDLDFTGADLSGLDFSEAEFSEAQLSGIRMAGVDLYRAWLLGATLRGADLSGARLRKVAGRGCDLRGANLRGVDLERSDFDGADFRDADLSGARFGRAFLPNADLRGANLSDCVFGSTGPVGLLRARLAGCRLAGATGSVTGPIDVGADDPHLIDGSELHDWFASQGAPQVEITPPKP